MRACDRLLKCGGVVVGVYAGVPLDQTQREYQINSVFSQWAEALAVAELYSAASNHVLLPQP